MTGVRKAIEKRKTRWRERGDLEYDKLLVKSALREIMRAPSLREEIVAEPWLLIELSFYVVTKEKKTVPFFFNEVQTMFIGELRERGTKRPFLVLKGRQEGFTTLITALQLAFCITRKNFSGFTIADDAEKTMAIFNDKARAVFDRLDPCLKPSQKFNSRRELFFDKLNSSWRIAVAKGNVARSMTLNFVHLSEAAFYSCDLSEIQAGLGEALVEGAFVIYETTANGFNQFRELWRRGSCVNLFYPWWLTSEYRSSEWAYLETDDPWLLERKELLFSLGLDREQVCWYCKKYAGLLDSNLICQEYPCSPEEAFIVSGKCVFNKRALQNQMTRVSNAGARGRHGVFEYKKTLVVEKDRSGEVISEYTKLEDIVFREREDGYIVLHAEPLVKKNDDGTVTHTAPYVIGGDTAGTGEDYFTAKVICNLDGSTAATLHVQTIDEDLYAEQLYCLGAYYNDALIGVEINYSQHPTRVLVRKLKYPNLYRREILSTSSDKAVFEYGFDTSEGTRRTIIAELVTLMREKPHLEVHMGTLEEMMSFVKKKNGRQEAQSGCHDDLVMALAIAHFISHSESRQWQKVKLPENDFIKNNFHTERAEQKYFERGF